MNRFLIAGATAAALGFAAAAPVAAATFTNATPYQCFDASKSGGTTNLGSIADGSVGLAIHQIGGFTGTCNNDSPFADVPGTPGVTWFFVEDFEDGLLNTPGIVANQGSVIPPGFPGFIDSVDADDGAIDGSGNDGHTWFISSGASGLTISFDETSPALNGLFPTHAGLVWTDGNAVSVKFEAFDPLGDLIGFVIADPFGDGNFSGGTAEDRFFGVVDDGGIGSIRITALGGGNGLEVDHVQFGRLVPFATVPEPAALGLLGIGLLGLGAMRRRRR